MRRILIALALAAAPLGAQRGLPPPPLGGPAPTVTLPAPVGVIVRNDPAALVFSWQPVVGATGYQIEAAPAVIGPWTALVPQPLATNAFTYTPAPGVLTYYRIAAVHALGNAGLPTIVPFIYNVPFNETGVSAVQSGSDLKVSWIPVAGAIAYDVEARIGTPQQRQVFSPGTSATFAGLIPPGLGTTVSFAVVPQFPRGPAVQTLYKPTQRYTLGVVDPILCWPAAGGIPGGPAPAALAAVARGSSIEITWTVSGQVLAHRVERAPTVNGNWEPAGCVEPRLSSSSFFDHAVALQPSTDYAYRVTAIGPGGVVGASVTTFTTPPHHAPVVAVSVSAQRIDLNWTPGDHHIRAYEVSSSYGYRAISDVGGHAVSNAPVGKHVFAVRPIYMNGTVARGTTVAVTVQ